MRPTDRSRRIQVAVPGPMGSLPDGAVGTVLTGGGGAGSVFSAAPAVTSLTASTAVDTPIVGSAAAATRIRCSLGTPASLADGDVWIEASGVSPARVLSLKVRDGGVTRTLVSVTY